MNDTNSIYLEGEQPWIGCGVHLRNLEDQAMGAKRAGLPAAAVAVWIGNHVTHYERLFETGDRSPELADKIME